MFSIFNPILNGLDKLPLGDSPAGDLGDFVLCEDLGDLVRLEVFPENTLDDFVTVLETYFDFYLTDYIALSIETSGNYLAIYAFKDLRSSDSFILSLIFILFIIIACSRSRIVSAWSCRVVYKLLI
jgi:hypothetical protein